MNSISLTVCCTNRHKNRRIWVQRMFVTEFYYAMLDIKSEVSSINNLFTGTLKTHYSPCKEKTLIFKYYHAISSILKIIQIIEVYHNMFNEK